MDKNKIVAALDIGTTKICAIVGRMNQFGKLEILGIGKTQSEGVTRGLITNIEKTTQGILKAIEEASNQSGVDIKVVNVGIAGQYIKSSTHKGSIMRDNPDEMISVEDVERITNDMYKLVMPPGVQIIHVMPQDYVVDNEREIKDPVGMVGSRVEADFHVIAARTDAVANILRSVHKAGLEIENIVLEPIASSMAVLMPEEKEAGVVLVDIGGGTTDIAMPIQQQATVDPTQQPPVIAQNNMTPQQPIYTAQSPAPQQQVYGQPTMPMQPPMQPQSFNTTGSAGKKKKLFIIGGTVAATLIVVLAGVFLFSKLSSVSQDDYRKASSTVNTTESKLSEAHSAVTSLTYMSNSTETQVTNNVDSAKKAIEEYKLAVGKLKDEKALKNGEVNKQYKAFKELDEKHLPIIESFVDSSGKVLVPITKCTKTLSETSTTTATGVIASLKDCITSLSGVENVSDSDMKSLVTTTVSTFKEVSGILEQLNSTPTSNYALRSELRTKYYDAYDTYRDRAKDIDSNIEKKLKDSDPTDTLRTLSDTIFNLSLKK